MRFILLLSALVFATGCGGRTGSPPTPPPIFVTSFDALRLIVQPIAGELPVEALLAPGTSPHAYSPRPSEALRMQEAELVIHAHANIDGWVADLAPEKAYALFGNEESPDHSEDHSHGDAHFWTDPVSVSRAIRPLADALCSTNHDSCPAFRRRATVLRAAVDSLHHTLERLASERETACIISSEPFADRMLERYGIPHVGPLRISADVPPTPTRMSQLIREANDVGCRRLLVQSAFENRMEHRLASEQGWEVVEVDPLGGTAEDLLTYLSDLFDALTLPSPPLAP
jgi:zinc transport system substrate-binding protein